MASAAHGERLQREELALHEVLEVGERLRMGCVAKGRYGDLMEINMVQTAKTGCLKRSNAISGNKGENMVI